MIRLLALLFHELLISDCLLDLVFVVRVFSAPLGACLSPPPGSIIVLAVCYASFGAPVELRLSSVTPILSIGFVE